MKSLHTPTDRRETYNRSWVSTRKVLKKQNSNPMSSPIIKSHHKPPDRRETRNRLWTSTQGSPGANKRHQRNAATLRRSVEMGTLDTIRLYSAGTE
ncbi:hypothetical protein BaRGS_00017356 [Batillaria attramentaria]|uniref:Uncharacterized protein n=1 Tax=Batillaria attramentaria TaxID=370345 RepID=A0ABD0KVQ7_9CAEN